MNKQTKNSELADLLDELDPPYESKEELKIGRMLDQYGIPFFYKQATVIYNDGKNEIWYPSFTLPQYSCAVVDYVTQQKQADERIDIYRYNQIPATVLGQRDINKPNWQEILYEKLKQIYRHPIEEMNYSVPCNPD